MIKCKRLLERRGGTMLKVVFIMMIMIILISFMFQIFMIYSTANSVSSAVQDSVLSVAAANKPKLYNSLREGNTAMQSKNFSGGAEELISTYEMSEMLSETLGVVGNADMLIKPGNPETVYTIHNLTVTMENSYSRDREQTLEFVTELELEIPVAIYWNFGSLKIPMKIRSKYTAKY